MVHRVVTISSISSWGGLASQAVVTWTVERPPLGSNLETVKMYAPNLETVKIRGCWSLTELPLIHSNKVVSCDCEKEWWDNLDWDFREQSSYTRGIIRTP